MNQKFYRLWYELNKRLVLRIRTGAGETEEVEVGGMVGQGTCGASLVSQHNIDSGVDSYFRGSTSESFYGTVRLQPLLFVDDCLWVADGVREAQAGQEKMLSFHKSKSIYLVYGSKKYHKEVEEQVNETPMTPGNIHLKKKEQQKYLGDILDERGLEASVMAAVKAREGKTKGGIYELRWVCHDFCLQLLGGMVGAIVLWEECILSSLLTNCGTWTNISEETIMKLDDLQNLFVQVLLKLPHSTPRLSMRALTGMVGMRWIWIWKQKISLVDAIKKLHNNTLAKETFND